MVFESLRQIGKYSHVDLDFVDGRFVPHPRGWTSGPDEFELAIGNTLVYSVSLWERGDYLRRLENQWLPYYDEALRLERLTTVRRYCRNNLDHIPLYVDRGLYFQAFNRLYDAFQEFLQALFISRRTYPIAYDKWIREQVEEILGMPKLYQQLPGLFEAVITCGAKGARIQAGSDQAFRGWLQAATSILPGVLWAKHRLAQVPVTLLPIRQPPSLRRLRFGKCLLRPI